MSQNSKVLEGYRFSLAKKVCLLPRTGLKYLGIHKYVNRRLYFLQFRGRIVNHDLINSLHGFMSKISGGGGYL